MRLFVTGAGGFLGTAVVEQACERGHTVVGLVRSASSEQSLRKRVDAIETVRGDLRRPDEWIGALAGVDAVIHLAATKSGGFYPQFAGTVIATESLLAAMTSTGVDRLIHVSTFSVYDYQARSARSRLDESVPVETADSKVMGRDDYARTKLYQERLVADAAEHGMAVTVIRPGAVWGGDDLWDGGTGQIVGPLWVAAGDGVTKKFTYVENCAEAIVLAAERSESIGQTINIVDDDVPNQRAYAQMLRQRGIAVPKAVPVPFALLKAMAAVLDKANKRFVGGRARLPSMLVPAHLDARFKPFDCPNDRAKSLLGWRPRYSVAEGLDRAVARRQQH